MRARAQAGALRSKNAKNIMLKNLMDACIGGFVYYAFGYAICYQSPGDGTGDAFSGGLMYTDCDKAPDSTACASPWCVLSPRH